MPFRADLQDLEFQLFDWLRLDELLEEERFADWDGESVRMVLEQAVEMATRELAPINGVGDREGVVWEAGEVTLPPSVHGAWKVFREGGWIGCSSSPSLGGLGLPHCVGSAALEVLAGANLSFNLVALLTRGAAQLIADYGGAELTSRTCERMLSGEWTGSMCLTEPQAGSDVGASTTRAERQSDGTYRISGEKIFITSGEHDLSTNIVHAVLARVPGAAAGSRGLSLFVVPKRWIDDDGSLAADNDVYCAGVEHKLGIHASPTCSMVFGREGRCRGYLLGEEGQGLRLMFDMMNAARIEVGVQAAAVASAAHQAALDYARERVQMRRWDAPRGATEPAAIIEHPDVRRMLLTSAAYVQAMRALLLRTSLEVDRSHGADPAQAAQANHRVALLTPVCKAWASDWGFRVTEWSLQVFGGYGYTADYPAEQYLRDVKITSIYEGSNGIQALDFVGRKLGLQGGDVAGGLLQEVEDVVLQAAGNPRLAGSARQVRGALAGLRSALGILGDRADGGLMSQLNAVPILDTFGTLLGGSFLLQHAMLAEARLVEFARLQGIDLSDATARDGLLREHRRAAFWHDKVQAAICFCHRAVPAAVAPLAAIEEGARAEIEAVF